MWPSAILYISLFGMLPWPVRSDITVPISNVKPLPLRTTGVVSSASALLQQSCPDIIQSSKKNSLSKIIVSSYSSGINDVAILDDLLFPSSDSFIRGAIDAWAQHQTLVLRPDVVWFEILAQLNLYMTKHAEDVRSLFVSFQGQEEIIVRDWTWREIIDRFKSEIQRRVKTDWLEEWITPGFSTSTANDNTTSTILMMGLMQHYFKFTGSIICGLPFVQLLGTREDWVALLAKLDRLRAFGAEPSEYAQNLRPILSFFVRTWDNPKSEEVKSFWKQIVRADKVFSCGAGPTEYDISGWITGFMHWSSNGDLRVLAGSPASNSATKLDNIVYHSVGLDQVPVGYAKAPLKMLDYPSRGTDSMAYVVAGNIGIARGVTEGVDSQSGQVLSQPLSAWFLYGPVDVDVTTTGFDVGSRSEVQAIYQNLRNFCPAGGA